MSENSTSNSSTTAPPAGMEAVYTVSESLLDSSIVTLSPPVDAWRDPPTLTVNSESIKVPAGMQGFSGPVIEFKSAACSF